MSAKPATVPRWARTAGGVDASNLATPSSGEQDTGWTNGQNPVASTKMNWLFNWLYQWIFFLNDSPVFTATTAAAPGLTATGGSGNSHGLVGNATGTGAGLRGTASATAGSVGVYGTGTTGTAGVQGDGAGASSGVVGNGGATGPGITGNGGATSGAGVVGNGVAGNSSGVVGNGQGSAAGVVGTGGATGAGLSGIGGATSGAGVTGTGTAGNSRGGNFTGQGTAEGVLATGGATGPGLVATAGGGGSPARGSLALTSQATPSAPSNGDAWYETTAWFLRLSGLTNKVMVASSSMLRMDSSAGDSTVAASTTVVKFNSYSSGRALTVGTALTHDNVNGRITANIAGTYRVHGLLEVGAGPTTNMTYTAEIRKNQVYFATIAFPLIVAPASGNHQHQSSGSIIMTLAAADQIEMYYQVSSGTTPTVYRAVLSVDLLQLA